LRTQITKHFKYSQILSFTHDNGKRAARARLPACGAAV
jgi:hypothetical protein